MTFPTVAGFGGSNSGANVTTTTVDLEALAGVASVGDLLLVILGIDGTEGGGWPSGWTSIYSAGTTQSLTARYHIVESGDPTSIDVTHGSQGSSHQVYRIQNGTFNVLLAEEHGLAANGGPDTAPNPPSINPIWPSSWDVLWIAISVNDDGTTDATVAPTNYTDLRSDRWNNADGVCLATARRLLAADSEDPGAFTIGASETWITGTIAIAPATGFPQAILSGGNSGGNTTSQDIDVALFVDTPVAGDLVIILAYCQVQEQDARSHRPKLVYVDGENRIVRVAHERALGVPV